MALKILNNLRKKYKNLNGYDPLIDQNIAIKKGLITSHKEFLKYKIYVIITKHKKLVVKINKIPIIIETTNKTFLKLKFLFLNNFSIK